MHVFFLNFARFFLLWELVYVFQSLCRSLQKSDRTRCLAVSFLENNINWKGRTKWCSLRRVNIGDPVYRIISGLL